MPAAGWGWLLPPSPAAAQATIATGAAAAAALAVGVLPRLAAAGLLASCTYLAAFDQEPGSQLNSLLLQLGVANCLLPLGSCWTLGGVLRQGAARVRRRRRKASGDEAAAGSGDAGSGTGGLAAAAAVQLWSVLLLRALLVKPYAQDALAKLSDGWTWLVRAQPLAQRLAPATRGLPGAAALPWVAAWTSCLLDLAVSGT